MRTSTKFIKGNGYEEFKGVLAGYYPAGKVAIIAQDVNEGEKLARTLGRDYETCVYTEGKNLEGVRFVIGVGGSGVIPAVKRTAKNAKYAFIPTVFDYRFLYAFDGIFTLPEFVYLSESLQKEEFYCARLYQTVFQLYAECIFSVFYTSAFPYRDVVKEAYIGVGEKILSGMMEESVFYEESLRFITNIVNHFYSKDICGLVTESAAKEYGVTVGERFAITRFLILMLINFTKHSFHGILLPSEKPVFGVKAVGKEAFDGKILPSKEKIAIYNEKMAFLTEVPAPDISGMLRALALSAEESPIFSIINNEGITEALYYEKFKRSIGIPV